jgi:RimJ/RimL family protein N-acetyltransferase
VPRQTEPVGHPDTRHAAFEPVEITAGRLHLRPWEPRDAGAVLAACRDPELLRWTTLPDPYTEQDAQAWVEQLAPAAWREGTGAHFAVLDAVDGRLLAAVGFSAITERGAEIGFWCVPAERGRGVVPEAVAAVCRWGFGALGLHRVTWLTYVGNDASRRVADKAGFRFEGTLRGYLVQRGQRRDAWIGGLLPGDAAGSDDRRLR